MRIKDLWVFVGAIPFMVVSVANSVNIPVVDDYEMILGSLIDWKKSGFWDKIVVLFAQYNEHRIVFPRLVYVMYYSIFGEVNFRALSFLANLQLLVVASVGVYFIRKVKVNWQLNAFIWVLLVCDLNTYENGAIASYGMQNWSVLMWVFLAFYGYDKGGRWWILGCAAQFIAVFCSGNGMIAGPFLILCFPQFRTAATVAFISSISLYFFCGYEFVHQPDQYFNIGTIVAYFFHVLGAPVSFGDVGLLIGVVLVVFVSIGCWIIFEKKESYKTNWCPMLAIGGFVVASIAEASVFRSGLPNAQWQTSRYLIYPQLILGIVFILLPLERRVTKIAATTAYLLMSYHNFAFGKLGFERTADRAQGYKYYHPNFKAAEKIATEAANQNIYFLNDNR